MDHPPRRLLGRTATAVAVALLAAALPAGAQAAPAAGHPAVPGWTGSWEAAPAMNTADSFPDRSIRNVVHTSLGGFGARIRLSNRFGTAPQAFGHVTVAVQAPGENTADAVPGTLRQVRFHGAGRVTAAPGADVVSDPVALAVPPDADLLITVYLPTQSGPGTFHGLAEQTSFIAPTGDHASDVAGAAFTQQTSAWYYLTGVDVLNPAARGSVVTLGDSTTDSYLSTYGANHRWPDLLADRIATLPPYRRLGVLNAGISGNRLLLPGNPPVFGPSALDRLDGDVLSRAGARTVIVLLGINDIQQDPHQTDPAKITTALRTIAHRAHAGGLRVIGGTIMPFKGWIVYDETLEATRLAVNRYLRTSRDFDAMVDFDRAIRDPADPLRMRPGYDSGDHLHPGDAGYQAMADAVDLRQL
jgi:lysophospholipase L1-like esterase